MNKINRFLSYLRTSFWVVPSLIVVASIALAVFLIAADSTQSEQWLAHWPRLFGAGAEGARGMLSTIAGSMMTVVGVTFSMILVALALASSQYSSRILQNFTNDRVTQVVLGIFAGIFAYSLIVLRTIRAGDESAFVPSLAVFLGVVLAISGISVLIFFIHHIASSIQASNIIASVARETLAVVDRVFPEKLGQESVDDEEAQAPLSLPAQNWQPVLTKENGYIQCVDSAALLCLAREHNTIVRMERGIGEFVVQGTSLASLALELPPEKKIVSALQAVYTIARHRTVEQDCAFGIRQLVDMALRSLSPGINDTTTAVMCVDYLTAILARLASRPIPSSHRYEAQTLRVIAIGPTFAKLVAESFDQIRESASGNVGIMLRMLDALQIIAGRTSSLSRRQVLREHMQSIAELAKRSINSARDRKRFDNRLACVREELETQPNLFEGAQRANAHRLKTEQLRSAQGKTANRSAEERLIKVG